MKRRIASGLIAITALSILFSDVRAVAAGKWNVLSSNQKFIVNDKQLDVGSLNSNDNYVKIGKYAELLDNDIGYNEAVNTIALDKSKPFSEAIVENDTDTKGISENNLFNEIEVNIPSVSGKIFVKSFGNHILNKGEEVHANINWNGDGSVMLLYTKDAFSTEDITKLVDKRILPLNANNKTFNDDSGVAPSLSSNFTYVRKSKKLKLNFITTPTSPINYSNEVPETADYYIYIIVNGDTGITNIQGSITMEK